MSYPKLSVACQELLTVSQDMLDLGLMASYTREIGIAV